MSVSAGPYLLAPYLPGVDPAATKREKSHSTWASYLGLHRGALRRPGLGAPASGGKSAWQLSNCHNFGKVRRDSPAD